GRTGPRQRRAAADGRMPAGPGRVLREETRPVGHWRTPTMREGVQPTPPSLTAGVRPEQAMNPIVGIGELLWDVYPDGRKVAGGAPFNFAFHCRQLGHDAVIVSRVGDDEHGREL